MDAEKNVICYDHARSDLHERGYIQNSQIYEMQKLRKKNMRKKKNNFKRQYLRGLAICLRSQSCKDFTIYRKKYKMQQYIFLFQIKQHQNPNLNGLSFKKKKKNLIKNHSTFILGQIIIQIKHNYTLQSLTLQSITLKHIY